MQPKTHDTLTPEDEMETLPTFWVAGRLVCPQRLAASFLARGERIQAEIAKQNRRIAKFNRRLAAYLRQADAIRARSTEGQS